MFLWEVNLIVRRRSCEFRLFNYRERHSSAVAYRDKHSPTSVAWNEFDKIVRINREKIERELDEIEFVRQLAYAGPIVGGQMYIQGEHDYRGPTILDLFDREADKWHVTDIDNDHSDDYVMGMNAGIMHAKEILTTPYKFLNEEERKGFDMADKSAKEADARAEEMYAGESAKRGPGRPRKTHVPKPPPPPAAKAVLMRINPETGKAERV